MKKELQDTLFERYPKIFIQKDLPATKSCMYWGLDCGDGWYSILDNLCNAIQSYCDNNTFRHELNGLGKRILRFKRFRNSLKRSISTSEVEQSFVFKLLYKKYASGCSQVEGLQGKEKYGTLRFYFKGGDKAIEGMVDLAGRLSEFSCEGCGCPSSVMSNDGWYSTLC